MAHIPIPQTIQTAGPFNLGGGELIFMVIPLLYGLVIVGVVIVVKAIVRISHATVSIGKSLEQIAAAMRDGERLR